LFLLDSRKPHSDRYYDAGRRKTVRYTNERDKKRMREKEGRDGQKNGVKGTLLT
jgi:hypothetical protein